MRKTFIALFCSVALGMGAQSEIHFVYDGSGNRISRTFYPNVLLDEVKNEQQVKPTAWMEDKINISPNPTGGIFIVEFLFMEKDAIYDMQLYSPQKMPVDSRKNKDYIVQYDLSCHPPGIYFLQISLGENSFTGKVIKK